jgi:putative ABC transport system permease protein
MNDLRFALRQLRKSPGFTLVAVLTLALGIGANTAIFSVVNAVLLKPLPFPAPEQLVAVGVIHTGQKKQEELGSLSYPDYFDLRQHNHTLSHIAVYRPRSFGLADEQEPKSVRAQLVSGDFFDALGINPMVGRNFSREDEQAGGGSGGFKVILTYEMWQRHFGAERSAIGRTLTLDRKPYTVIGVLPAGFQFPIQTDPTDLYVTIADDASNADGSTPVTEERGNHSLEGVARLKAGVSIEQARADLATIAAALEKQYPEKNTNTGFEARPMREQLVGDVRTGLYVLFGAVVCVLLIANANVANLLLARASVRGKEIAVRAAMGAGRGRIIRQLLTESLLLAGLGGVLGLLLAQWGTDALVAAVPQNIPRAATIQLDPIVLGFTLLISIGTGVVFGLVPAWQASKVDLNSALKSGTRTGGGSERKARLRNSLVIIEVALALVLLICAGLLIQSFARLGRVQPGLRTEHLLTARIGLPAVAYPRSENVIAFLDQLLPRLRNIPGVESASTIMPLPLGGGNAVSSFDMEEHPMPEGKQYSSHTRIISADYFKTMGIPILQGRAFDRTDRFDSAPVVIINARFAQRFFPGEEVIGKRIKPSWSVEGKEEVMREIVGVVGNVKHLSLRNEDTPEVYLPQIQLPLSTLTLVVRTGVSNPGGLTPALRAELAAVDRNIPLTEVRLFEDYMTRSLARPRFNAFLLSIFAGAALLLTAIGIYGVMAYSVAQRTNEIGIRMALGAQQSSIFRLIVGQAMALVAISLAVGLAAAFGATRLLNSLLFGVGASDPVTFSAIVLLVSFVAFLAAWLPARRATLVDPIQALRTE